MAFTIYIFFNNVWAADPCATLGIAGTYNAAGKNCQVPRVLQTPLITPLLDQNLFARIIVNQGTQINQMGALITNLQNAIAGLTQAVNNLSSVSQALITNNDKWQKVTLDQTISSINEMPSMLAQAKDLQTILAATIKQQLVKDSGFIEALRNESSRQ